MDMKLLLTTFGIIFLAELGDKTQFGAVMLAAQTQKPWTVFAGASLALVSTTLLAVIFASFIASYLPAEIIKKAAALGFMVIGLLIFLDMI